MLCHNTLFRMVGEVRIRLYSIPLSARFSFRMLYIRCWLKIVKAIYNELITRPAVFNFIRVIPFLVKAAAMRKPRNGNV